MSDRDNDEGAVEYGPSSVSFDEIEQARSAPGAVDPTKLTLDGDEIPEDLRGKSLSEVLTTLSGLQNALRISEEGRIALKNSQEALESTRPRASSASLAAPAPEPELNDEQLQALYDDSPRKYQDYLASQAEKRLLRTVQGIMAPVVGNTTDMTLRDAKSRYPDEFAAFGGDIQTFISSMPDKNALAQPGAMDELMDWMRGKHWKKFQEHLTTKTNGGLDDARDSMRRETPPDFSRTPQRDRNPSKRGAIQLDDVQKEIAAAMNLSPEQYAEGIIPTRGRRG